MKYFDTLPYTETFEPTHGYTFTGPCKKTKQNYSVTIPADELFEFRQGLDWNKAMPSVNLGDKEFLKTGISPEGWTKLFGN